MVTMFEWIWNQCSEKEREEIKKISKKFDMPLDEAANWYESCNHSYSWAVSQIEEYYKKHKNMED